MYSSDELAVAAVEELERLAESRDIEMAHVQADEIMANFVRQLGYAGVSEAFDKVGKWYA